jgi:hypothetical protein
MLNNVYGKNVQAVGMVTQHHIGRLFRTMMATNGGNMGRRTLKTQCTKGTYLPIYVK